MAKNSKSQQKNGTSSAAEVAAETPPLKAGASPKKTAKTAPRKAASKKTAAKSGARKAAPRRAPRKSGGYEPTDSEISIRAYFIAERRAQLGLEADPNNDWIEARRQLIEEVGQSGTPPSAGG